MWNRMRCTVLCLPLALWTACGDDDSTADADVGDVPAEEVAPDAADADADPDADVDPDDGVEPEADAADDAGSCVVEERAAQPFVQALMLLHDRSISMTDVPWWEPSVEGVAEFLAQPASAGLLVGLQFFPVPPTEPVPTTCTTDTDCGLYGPCVPMSPRQCAGAFSPNTSCVYADYAVPAVALGENPAAASAAAAAYAAAEPTGEATPTQPAVRGTLEYFLEALDGVSIDLASLVLVTDGEPTGCTFNTIEDTATIVAGAFADVAAVTTHVIQFGVPEVDFTPIAAAGGTGTSHQVTATGDVAGRVAGILEGIRAARDCRYRMPVPTTTVLDVEALNLELRDPATPGGATTVPKVAAEAACSSTDGGWYFAEEPGPGPVVLCPATCEVVTTDAPEVVFVFGCPTVAAP